MVASPGPLRLKLYDDGGSARLTSSLVERVIADLDAAADRVVILEGGPNAFCEGLDFDQMGATDAAAVSARVERFASLVERLRRHTAPVVAVVNGRAIGGGLGLAAVADVVIASPRATFALPEALFGIIPAVVFPVIAARIGVARARRLVLTGGSITAAEALAGGLVDEVAENTADALVAWLSRLSRVDPVATAAIKQLVAQHYGPPEEYIRPAVARFGELAVGDVARARVARFAAGETPWPDREET